MFRWLLKRLIANACPATIPRSGSEGELVNCYSVALDRDEKPYFLATEISGDTLIGLTWNGRAYANDAEISISDLDNGSLNITHFYGLSEVNYDNIYQLAWNYLTRFVYLKIRVYEKLDSSFQFLFNKRKVITKRRIDILKIMIESQMNRDHDGISSLDLLEQIYSLRMFLHPSLDLQTKKLEFYLDSLVDSGDLRKTNYQYIVNGKALSTIEKFEEDERRHTEAVKIQRKVFWLTFITMVFAIVQSGLVKLPTVFDWS